MSSAGATVGFAANSGPDVLTPRGSDTQSTPPPARTTTFEPAATAVSAARRFVSDASQFADTRELELLVSEVASNAVFHARSPFTVSVIPLADGIRVEVGDRDSRPPQPLALDPSRANGRGLLILQTIARRWGSYATSSGKVVWFELGSTPGAIQ